MGMTAQTMQRGRQMTRDVEFLLAKAEEKSLQMREYYRERERERKREMHREQCRQLAAEIAQIRWRA